MFDRRRPDPAQGVFETLLVLDGRPVELDAHLNRLEASLETLFPDHSLPPLDVPVEKGPYGHLSTGTVDGHGLGALRISVAPGDDGGLEAQIERRKAPLAGFMSPAGRRLPTAEVSLRRLTLAGGLGAHKWADRSLLDEAQATLPEGALPILVDEDGTVLEAARANVFAVRDGRLLTPPTDGRILPGVTRMRVLEIAAGLGVETAETALASGDLLAADEVFLTGSVRGIEPALSLDGAPLRHEGEISGRLAAELRRAWAGATTAS
ncbi:MAG TPA: aminotransferase class IV [Solirubrobacterales bacterium]